MCSCIWDVYFDHVLTQRFLIFDISTMVELARESKRFVMFRSEIIIM